jgi:hypothetical protein
METMKVIFEQCVPAVSVSTDNTYTEMNKPQRHHTADRQLYLTTTALFERFQASASVQLKTSLFLNVARR